jgi:hypothetical protein
MIVAIEGLIPDRRLSPSATQPAAPPGKAQIYSSEWRREQQHQAAGEEPGDAVAAAEAPPPPAPGPPPPPNTPPPPTRRAPGPPPGAYTRASPRTGERHVFSQP